MAKARSILAFLCFAVSAAFAQHDHMHMTGMMMPPSEANMSSTNNGTSNQMAMVPSFADCVAGAQCWHGSGVYPLVASQIFSSSGFVFAIDSSNSGYQLENDAWTKHTEWGAVYGLQSDGAGNIFALVGSCGGSGHIIAEWNGSSFTNIAGCYRQFWIGANDGVLALDLNGAAWLGNLSGQSQMGLPPGEQWFISASWYIESAGAFLAVTQDNQIWLYDGTRWGQPTGGTCCALSISADTLQNWYVVGGDNNLYHYNGTNGFDKLAYSGGTIGGGYGGITNGGTMQIWAVGPNVNGNTLYRFADQAIQLQHFAHGQINCTPIPPFNQSVCNSFIHTATWYAGWGALHGGPGSTSKTGYMNFNGPGTWNVNAIANLDNVFDAAENPQNYSMNVDGDTECSGDGELYGDNPPVSASIVSVDYGQYNPGGQYTIQEVNQIRQAPITYPGCPACQPPFYSYYVASGTCLTTRACSPGTSPSHPSSQTFPMDGMGGDEDQAKRNVGANCAYNGPVSTLGIKYESLVIPYFNLGVSYVSYRQPIPQPCS